MLFLITVSQVILLLLQQAQESTLTKYLGPDHHCTHLSRHQYLHAIQDAKKPECTASRASKIHCQESGRPGEPALETGGSGKRT